MAEGSATKLSGPLGLQAHVPETRSSSRDEPGLPMRFALDRPPPPAPVVDDESTPAESPPPPRWTRIGAAALAAIALLFVAVGRTIAVRALLPFALAVAAIAFLVAGRRRRAVPPRRESTPRVSSATATPLLAPPSRSLVVDADGLRLESGANRMPLIDLSSREFGMTILSDRLRTRAIVAITSKAGACFLGGRILPEDRLTLAPILARALVIPTEEVALDAIGPDGRPIELRASDFRAVVEWLERFDPASSDRLILSDLHGEPLELRGEELVVRGQQFDLTRPLEWRSILFQESFGQAFALYQGTWIRQGPSEVVLVSLLPAGVLDPSPLDFMRASNPDLDLRAMRDQRLMQATAGAPPPFEQRVAVDGLFMLPLRVALDQAPRSSKLPASARHA